MKNVSCFLKDTKENKELLHTLENDNEFNVVDLATDDEKEITVIVNDSFTELAHLMMNNWKKMEQVKEILFVGGSDKYGDVTPVAEKNIYADPESAQYIFLSRMHIVMFGLNVTRNLQNRAILPYLYMKQPSMFEKEECGIYVETKGQVTRGQTVIDIYSDKQFEHHDCELIKRIDSEMYQKYLNELN